MNIEEINPSRKYGISKSASVLGVCKKTVYNWIDKGWLKAGKDSRGRTYIKGLSLIKAFNDIAIN